VRRGGCLDVCIYGAACAHAAHCCLLCSLASLPTAPVAALISLNSVHVCRGSGCRPCTLAVLSCVSTDTAFMPDMSIITPSSTSRYNALCARSNGEMGTQQVNMWCLLQALRNMRTSECPPPRTDRGKPRAAAQRTISATCISSAVGTWLQVSLTACKPGASDEPSRQGLPGSSGNRSANTEACRADLPVSR